MTETERKITVMQAFVDGKMIGKKYPGSGGFVGWVSPAREPEWDWLDYEYFIKPTPLELWVNVPVTISQLPKASSFYAYVEEGEASSAGGHKPTLFRQVMDEDS